MKRTLVLAISVLAVCVQLSAYDFMVDKLCYNINSDGTSVTVTYQNNSSPRYSDLSGALEIPPSVIYEGTTYSVSAIGESAFRSYRSITTLSIPESVTSIGEYAFCECRGLTGELIIPNSVISIGQSAFFGCVGFTSLVIGNSVTSIGGGAFCRCSGLTSVTIPDSVTSIGVRAFYYCSNLTKVEISDIAAWCRITFESGSIEANPLYYAHHLYINGSEIKDLVIPDNVTFIDMCAFVGCSGLTSLTIPKTVTALGNLAFAGCNNLKTVNWNAKNCTIYIAANYEYHPFKDLTGINTFNFGDEVETIPARLCCRLSGLTSVTIPNSVTKIGDGAFSGCSGLTSVEVEPDNTKYDSRDNCNAIIESATNSLVLGCRNTVIPNSVSEILAYAFCRAPASITIPPSMSHIDKDAFEGYDDITAVEWNVPHYDDFTDVDSNPFRNQMGITAFTFGDNVTKIPAYLCFGLSGISSLHIPESVNEIGFRAFGNCLGITEITVAQNNVKFDSRDNCNAIVDSQSNKLVVGSRNSFIPNSVTSVGSYAFDGCSGLASIDIHSSVTTIGEKAFDGCSGLKTVNWNVAGYADCQGPLTAPFYGLDGITEFNFGDNVERIPAYLCCGLSGLTSIDIPDNVTEISEAAFSNCQGLASVTVSDNVKKIGNLSFSRCSNLTDVVLGESVEEIGWSSFSDCSSLAFVTIPNSVTKINAYAFAECKNLTEINFGNSLRTIEEYSFKNCSGLSSITIPESASEIGKYAFNGCFGLTTVTWKAKNCGSPTDYFYAPFFGLTNIKNFNFGNEVESIPSFLCNGLTGLTSLTIPASVATIGGSAFRNCDKLKSVTNFAETPQEIQPSVFENVDKTVCKLFVLSQSLEKYKAAAVWKEFLVEAGVEGVEADDETKTVAGYYNLQGVRIDNPERGQVSIVRYTDGSAAKVIVR